MSTYAVGVDIGGTKVAMGLVNEQGEVIAEQTIPTNLNITPEKMTLQICDVIDKLLQDFNVSMHQIKGIGIGAPGPLDPRNGRITCPPNLPNWVDFPIVEVMRTRIQLPLILENDANAATVAEHWIGAAANSDDFIYVTVSTGIGSGLYFGGKLISGFRGNAGDIGHMVVDPAEGQCKCGQFGCFEWIASGTAIARKASELLGNTVSTKEAFELYAAQHPLITPMIEQVFRNIGVGCVTLINAFDPEIIVIGGGVAQVGDPLFRAVQQYVSEYALNPSGRQTRIVPSKLQKNVGVVGAAALIHAV